jgi:hypothetical protein
LIKLNLLLLTGQDIRLTIDFNINDLCDNFNNILYDPKPPRVCKSSPEAGNWVQFRFSSTGDITGDIIFQQLIYRRIRIDKFTLKIHIPGIPVIPGILYILPLLRHLLCNYTISNNKMKFRKTFTVRTFWYSCIWKL